MFCTNSSIEYYGNGVQTDFQFPYEYFEQSDIKVLTWDNDAFSYKLNTLGIEYYFVNASTIRFTTAPPYPADPLPGESAIPNVVLVRVTDMADPMAVFASGSSIKARDLNDNFDQVRFGIQELRCLVDQNTDLIELGWQKSTNDTLYSNEEWSSQSDDEHIPTVKSVDLRLVDFKEELLLDAVNTREQNTGLWISDDLRFATTGAIAARHDTFLRDNNPVPNTFIQPGKFWIDTQTQKLSYWSQQGFWVNVATASNPPVYIGPNPPPNARPGDLWYDTTERTTYVYAPSTEVVGLTQDDSGDEVQIDTSGDQIMLDTTYVWADVRPIKDGEGGIGDAPKDGKHYVRKDGQWVDAELGGLGSDSQLVFLDHTDLARSNTEILSVQTIYVGDQPTSQTYAWFGYEPSTETPDQIRQIGGQNNSSLVGDSIPADMSRVTCKVTATFPDGSNKVIQAVTFCEIFTPVGGGGFPMPFTVEQYNDIIQRLNALEGGN